MVVDNFLKMMRRRSYYFDFVYLVSVVWNIVVYGYGIIDKLYFIYFEKEIRSWNISLFIYRDLFMIMWVYGKV